MRKQFVWAMFMTLLLLLPVRAESIPTRPFRIGGTVTVDGTQVTQTTDDGYTFVVTKQDGTAYVRAAEDTDGLSAGDIYIIDVPIFDVDDVPGGADPGDTAVIHVFKDGYEVTVTDPINGKFEVGQEGILKPDLNLTIITIADISVTKVVDKATTDVGDNVVFTVTLMNNGPNNATGVQVTDTLPAGLSYVSDDSGGSYNSGTGVWAIGNLANSASVVLKITAKVDQVGATTNTATRTASISTDPSAANDSDNAVVTGQAADISLTKAADTATANVGANVVFTVTVTNNGPDDATGVQVTDTLPAGLSYVSDDSGGSYNSVTGLWAVGNLANGASMALKITAKVDQTGAITNTATRTASAPIDTDLANDSANAVVTGQAADISVAKGVDTATADVGANVVFTITVTNNGPDNATGVQVTDTLPAGLSYVSDDSGGSYNSGTGVWAVGNLANGVSVALKITAKVDQVGAVTNTATRTASAPIDIDLANDSANAVVTGRGADISVAKVADTSDPSIGDNVVFTVTVTNNGPDDATGVQVTDTLPAGLSYVSDDSGGAYNSGTGVWTIGNLANGASLALKITAKVDQAGAIINTATRTASSPTDPNAANDSANAVVAGQVADISVAKVVDTATANVNDNVVFTITVTNNGPDDATGVQVTDTLPAGLSYVSDDSGGAYNSVTGVWTAGNLANGASMALKITAKVDQAGSIINTATRTASSPTDPTAANDSANAVVIGQAADISVAKAVDKAIADVGANVVFTVTVTNNGPNDATGVQVTDTLPAGLSYVSDDSGGSYNSVTGLWAIGNLANGVSVALRITAKVEQVAATTNTAIRTASAPTDINAGNDSANAVVTGRGADISVTKAAIPTNPSIGDNVIFTITVTNNGPDDATGIQVTDTLPAGLSYVSDDSGGSYNSGTGVWAIGNLANSASAALKITAKVDQAGAFTNTATRTASNPTDTNASNDIGSAVINAQFVDTDTDNILDNWEIFYFGDLSHDGTADGDNDTLTDLEEFQNGTDPTLEDTDEDGMPDGWEVDHGLNPLVNDANGDLDGDGDTNLDEYNDGTDPDNARPGTPALSSPVNEAIDVPLAPELQTEAFNDTDEEDTHGRTEWQVSSVENDFSEGVLIFARTSNTHLTSLQIPELILSLNSTCYWRVRFYDSRGEPSSWSEVFKFTTTTDQPEDSVDQDGNGIPDNEEVDDEVNLDGDETPDNVQADLKCINTVVGDGQIAVKYGANVDSIEFICCKDPNDIADVINRPLNLPLGLITFKLKVANPGDIAEVTIYLSEPAPEDAKWYKWNSIDGWVDYKDYAIFSDDGRSVTLELEDGGFCDADGVANGVIIDPSGFGSTAPTPAPPVGSDGGGCFIGTASYGLL